jgi:iron complex transport system ATP-binding protein
MNVPVDWIEPGGPAGSLAVHDINLVRGGRAVLQGVSLVAKPGRLLVLVGPNGAGKSSLLNVFAGLITPTTGHAALDGQALGQWSPAVLARRRAMLSQKVQLGFAFRVDEVVMLGRSPHLVDTSGTRDRRIVEEALRAAHAWELHSRNYLQLSGGEQQRVQLARVLAQVWERCDGSAWLLLDEPEAGLDIAHQHFILQRARLLARQGYGVIAVLHDLNLAIRYADDVALLAQGQLLRHGSAMHTLDPQTLSNVYGMALRHVPLDDGRWMLAPS